MSFYSFFQLMYSTFFFFLSPFVTLFEKVLTFRCDVWVCFSATDALKGEGLQEGVDWLQGKLESEVTDNLHQRKFLSAFNTTEFIRMQHLENSTRQCLGLLCVFGSLVL